MPTKVGTYPNPQRGTKVRSRSSRAQARLYRNKNAPAEARACPWRGSWAQYWALRVTPEKVLYAFTRTYQVPAAGLLMVQVSLLPLRYGRQV